MQSLKLALLRGALIQAREVQSRSNVALFEAVGINPVEWAIFIQPEYWNTEDARQANATLSKAMALGFQMTGVPTIGIIAEHIATVIQTFVQPTNWPVMCSMGASGLDGTRLIASDGEDIQQRETVSGERLFSLVLAAAYQSNEVYGGRDLDRDGEQS